jgi:UDP-N-acetylglucosamine:LPS N-acetylglucosamine transferase
MPTTILLCFSDTGGGHRTATEALEAALHERLQALGKDNDFVIVSDNIVEKTHPINRGFVELYNFLLRHSQESMRYYFWFIHWFKPNRSEFGYSLSSRYLQQIVIDNQPKVVVSVHPMTNHYLSRAIADVGQKDKVKLVTLITDPNDQLWEGWGCEGSDLTISPNQIVTAKLREWGIARDKIKEIGMPVHPDFIKPASAKPEEFRRSFGLEEDCFTLCINAGWAGGGNMKAIYRALEGTKRKIQVVFLCGHNTNLYHEAQREAERSSIPTAVLPFHDRMSDLMTACDLMVTKAGGLTTFEAVARRLPLAFDVITAPMPQEAGTIDILVDAGLAKRISKPNDIRAIVEAAQPRLDYMTGELPQYQRLDCTDAVYKIADIILAEARDKKESVASNLSDRSGDGTTDYVKQP